MTEGVRYKALGYKRSYLHQSFGNVDAARIVGVLGIPDWKSTYILIL